MVKSFVNALFGGMGRTLGRIVIYLLIGLIFFLIYDNAHAAAIYGPTSCTATHYRLIKNDEFGTDTYGVTSTTYNIPWSVIAFYGTENMEANTYYDIKITFINNIPSNFIRNVEFYQTSSLCGNYSGEFNASFGYTGKVLTFRVLTGPSLVDYWQVWLTLSGATSSNGISTVTLSKVDMTGSSGIIENANENTNTIINNQNQNTQDMIDNQDDNTQDIIDNQNQNTQDIINALDNSTYFVCSKGKQYFIIGSDKSYIASQDTGQINSNDNYFVTSPLRIDPNKSYTLNIVNATGIQYGFYCFYKSDKTLVSCTKFTDNTTLSYTFTSPNDSYYFATTLYRNNDVIKNAYLEGKNANICITNSYNSSRQDLLNTMFQQDTSDGDTNIFSTWWNNFDPISNPLGSVITLPITLAQKIVGFNSSSCQSINLGSLLGHNLTLTCFTLSSVLPDNASSLINTIDIIMSVSLLVVIIKNTYETIANLISLGGENEVKKQFRLPTPLEFMANLLNGGGN